MTMTETTSEGPTDEHPNTLAESTLPYPGELAAQDVRLLKALDRLQCEAIKWQQERNVLRALLARRDAELAQLRAKVGGQ